MNQECGMDLSTPAVVPTRAKKSETNTTQTFLIVDDSAVIRRRLVSMLSEIPGVRLVGEASDAVQGAELIRKERPDAVILDIRMPGRSGIGLLEEIKNDPERPSIIILTNYPYSAYQKRCMELGASHFFDKSTEFTELETVVREMAQVRS
jgi:two-component system response regulator YesN